MNFPVLQSSSWPKKTEISKKKQNKTATYSLCANALRLSWTCSPFLCKTDLNTAVFRRKNWATFEILKKSKKHFYWHYRIISYAQTGSREGAMFFWKKKNSKKRVSVQKLDLAKKNSKSWIVSFLKTRISDTRFRLKCLPYGVFIGTIWALGLSVRIFLKNWYFGQVIAKIIVYPSLPQSKAIQRSKFVCEFLLKNNADFTPKQFLKITLSTDLLSIFFGNIQFASFWTISGCIQF